MLICVRGSEVLEQKFFLSSLSSMHCSNTPIYPYTTNMIKTDDAEFFYLWLAMHSLVEKQRREPSPATFDVCFFWIAVDKQG